MKQETPRPRGIKRFLGYILISCIGMTLLVGILASRGDSGTAEPTAAVRAATVAVAATMTSAPAQAPATAPTAPAVPTAAVRAATVELAATSTSAPTPAPPVTPTPSAPSASKDGNLRAGPGTGYPIIGSVSAGEPLEIVGRNRAGDWYEVAGGGWIAAFLVAQAPPLVPVSAVIPALPTQPAAPAASRSGAVAQPNAFTCIGGCAVAPDPSCAIKGNVNSKGQWIYHMPGWRDYNKTNVRPEEGDRWFCTAEEARAAGFRPAQQ